MKIEQFTSRVKAQARRIGFDGIGIIRAEPMVQDESRYLKWIERGMAADLAYMKRQPRLRTRPSELAPGARSIITLAVNYYSGDFGVIEPGHGRIARYAWGKDYHEAIPPKLWTLVAFIEECIGRKVTARCFVDAVPLLERSVARLGGLGRIGFNSCLITDQFGSWVFLSEILLDVELAPDAEDTRACLSTLDCLVDCPTGAIPEPGVVDAGKCLSYHTIENRGIIPRPLRPLLGDWLFGCDVCQDVCPHNRELPITTWREFLPESGVGKTFSILEALAIDTDEAFRDRFRHTPVVRTKRRGLIRNAAIVAANTRYQPAVPQLVALAQSDPDPIIRGHAVWALGQLDATASIQRASGDEDPFVREEARAVLNLKH